MGAWIEIVMTGSVPAPDANVAPRVGAWIEIGNNDTQMFFLMCRSPSGGVD